MLEMLMDPLGALVITFFAMSIISIAGIALLYLSKNEKLKKGLLYFLGVWSGVIAYCGTLVTGMPAMVFGMIGLAAVVLQLVSKNEKRFMVARILVTISVLAGMVNCFLL